MRVIGRKLLNLSVGIKHIVQGAAQKTTLEEKLNFSKTARHILLCFSLFNEEIITYHACKFHRNTLSKNKKYGCECCEHSKVHL